MIRRVGLAARWLTAACLSLILITIRPLPGQTTGGPFTSVAIEAISGYAGHAFVYAQVSNSTFAYPAPTGTGHQSPFYSEWRRLPTTMPSCPWVWAVYVFDRASNTQINQLPPSAPVPNFGTSTTLCAGPTVSPVEAPPQSDATARLDLDLRVSVSPDEPVAGSPSVVSAVLSSSLTQDMNLYLSMAIEDWSVSRWVIDFGDGETAILNRPVGTVNLPHVYQSAGRFDARAVASISGHAQAAIYDHFGTVRLIQRRFDLEIGNHSLATTRSRPARSYLPPQVAVGVIPSLDAAGATSGGPGFRHVDALRGALTTFSVRLLLLREARLLNGGVPLGWGQSRLTAWRLDGPALDAPPGAGTWPGTIHQPTETLTLQWNDPDRIVGGQPQSYVVPVTLYVRTRYPDGHVAVYAIASSFSVSVDFPAQSG